jgi:hypothetical protein
MFRHKNMDHTFRFLSNIKPFFSSVLLLLMAVTSCCLSDVARYLIYDLLCYAFSARWHVMNITRIVFCYEANCGLPRGIHCTFVVSLEVIRPYGSCPVRTIGRLMAVGNLLFYERLFFLRCQREFYYINSLYTTRLDIQELYVLPTQCIYVFCVDLRTNSDYFTVQH